MLKRFFKSVLPDSVQHSLRRTYLARSVAQQGRSAEPEAEVLGRLVMASESVVDVGANVGVYTSHLSKLVGAQGHVYAFEPVPENYKILRDVVERSKLRNVTTFQAAVAAERGRQEFAVPKMGGFQGYYRGHLAAGADGENSERMTVDVVSLDLLVAEGKIPRVDLIKCDVEGYELGVIRGAADLIRTQKPGWLIEVSKQSSNQVFQLFREHGYGCFVYDGRLRSTDQYLDHEFSNYFFFHPDSKLGARAQQLLHG